MALRGVQVELGCSDPPRPADAQARVGRHHRPVSSRPSGRQFSPIPRGVSARSRPEAAPYHPASIHWQPADPFGPKSLKLQEMSLPALTGPPRRSACTENKTGLEQCLIPCPTDKNLSQASSALFRFE